jgi:putative SOS response-associated peptidase YedK
MGLAESAAPIAPDCPCRFVSRVRYAGGMCNLYTARRTGSEIAQLFDAATPSFTFDGDRDFYPKSLAPVIVQQSGARRVEQMRWGFPPPASARAPVTNVRNLASPFWRSALADAARRCLVPVTQFCEWEGEKGAKIKRWFSVPSLPVFAFAGIWRPTSEGAAFAFLTCEPNPLVAAIHPKAMPVILQPDDYARWLAADDAGGQALAHPFPSQLMAVI